MQHQGSMQTKGAMENRRAAAREKSPPQHRTAQEEKGKAENRAGAEAQGHRTAKIVPMEEQKEETGQRPPRFVEIDPVFRACRIVVIGDEILVADLVTRVIVDAIPV